MTKPERRPRPIREESVETQLNLHLVLAVARAIRNETLVIPEPGVPTFIPMELGSTVSGTRTSAAVASPQAAEAARRALLAKAEPTPRNEGAARTALRLVHDVSTNSRRRTVGITHLYRVKVPALTLPLVGGNEVISVPAQIHVLDLRERPQAYRDVWEAPLPVTWARGAYVRQTGVDHVTWEAWQALAARLDMQHARLAAEPEEAA